jgi:hypothetical protein
MKKVTPTTYLTYLSVIEGSVDSKAYLNQWAMVNGKKTDIAKNGSVSCAFFVSFILFGFGYTNADVGFISGIHATVTGLVRKLESSGWKKIIKPRAGAVIVWETAMHPTGPHAHIGFWIDSNTAVSNHPKKGIPKAHHPTFGVKKNGEPQRKIVAYYCLNGIEKS